MALFCKAYMTSIYKDSQTSGLQMILSSSVFSLNRGIFFAYSSDATRQTACKETSSSKKTGIVWAELGHLNANEATAWRSY
jgi:hypothetical protein